MALVAWYKLDGNGLDSSGNGNHGSVVGAIAVAGKIGQAMDFTSGTKNITIPHHSSLDCPSQLSVSAWVKITDYGRATIISKWYEDFCFAIQKYDDESTTRVWVWYSDGVMPYTSISVNLDCLVQDGEWHHIVMTLNKAEGVGRWWVDGRFSAEGFSEPRVGSMTRPLYIGARNGSANRFHGIIDDVRLYNHILSDKEIKELAKAKILHYKFDDFQEPTKNCVSNTDFENGWSDYVTGSSTGTTSFRIDPIYGKVMRLTKTDSGSGRYGRRCALSGMFGSVYTHSIYVRKLSGAGRIACMYVDASKSGGGLCVASNYKMLSSLPVGEWVRVAHSQDFSPDTLAGGGYAYVWIDSGSGDCEFALPQIECKPYATPFTPNERGGMVYDCSGYDYHAKLSLEETPEWVEDPEMGGSYRFNGSQSIKLNDSLPSPPDQVTVSAWVKTDDASAYQHVFSKGVNTISCAIYQSKMYCKFNIGGVNRNPKGNTILQSNRWYHLVWLYDGTNIKFYIDGKLDMTSPTYTGQIREDDATTIIGAEFSTYPMNMMKGLISDVRVYATALSDDDIKELYQTRAALDSHGNLYASEVMDLDSKILSNGGHVWDFRYGLTSISGLKPLGVE